MKPGFTLIELLIAMTVSSILALVLYGALWQVSRQSKWFDNRMSIGVRAATALNQLERDISGAFVSLSEQKDKPDKKKTPVKDDKRKPLQKIFYSVNKNKRLNTLTFISNNPLPDPKGRTPRIARVMYRVQPENKARTSFELIRQEALDLEPEVLKKNNKLPADRLIGGIRNITVSYLVTVTEKDKEPSQGIFNEWILQDGAEVAEVQKEKVLPQAAAITLTLWDTKKQRSREFKTTIFIPGHNFVFKEKEKTKVQPQKVAEKEAPSFGSLKKEDLQKMKELLQGASS